MDYKEEQIGWWLNSFFVLIILLIFFLNLFDDESQSLTLMFTIIVYSVFIIILLLFYKLKITLSDKFLRLSFGIGLIRKKILLSEVAGVNIVRTKWYNGWGIKMIKNGWLYNIQGLSAIELSFNNKKSIVQIGIKSNSTLEREIRRKIT